MFGISTAEIFLILLVIIVFIKPDDLPKFLRTLGKFYAKARKMYREIIGVKDRVMKEMDALADLEDSSAKKTAPPPTPSVYNSPDGAAPGKVAPEEVVPGEKTDSPAESGEQGKEPHAL